MSETDSGCLYLFTDIYPRVEPCTLYPARCAATRQALGVNVNWIPDARNRQTRVLTRTGAAHGQR
eukprot:114096-Prymnesium_polylepis.1